MKEREEAIRLAELEKKQSQEVERKRLIELNEWIKLEVSKKAASRVARKAEKDIII